MTELVCRVDREGDVVVVRRSGFDDRRLQLVDAVDRLVPWEDGMVDRGIAKVPADGLRRHLTGQATADDLAAIGSWLHDVLFGDLPSGQPDWDTPAPAGEAGNAEAVELTVAVGAGANALDWLPWETLHDGRGHLALRLQPNVAIARAVGPCAGRAEGSTTEAVHVLGRRMLVVIAGELTDPQLLPAAEYLGLLETLHRSGSGLTPIPLVNPYLREVAKAVETHVPDLVHVIARGKEYAEGGGALLFRGEPTTGKPTSQPDSVGVERLLAALTRPDGTHPSVLVLTAADPGIAQGFGYQPSLAAACARGGIALVVGMSGPVASRSCRNFAVGFYDALVNDEPVAVASAKGRRSILLGAAPGADAAPEVEWSYPTVWLSVDPATRFRMPGGPGLARRLAAANTLRAHFKAPRPFCSREEVVDLAFRAVHLDDQAPVLALHRNVTGAPVGATRALAELAGRLVLAGHVPLLFAKQDLREPSMDADGFARAILKALRDIAADLQVAVPDSVMSALAPLQPPAGLSPKLGSDLQLDPDAATDGRGRMWALREALLGVRENILAQLATGEPHASGRSFVLLVDDLDLRGPMITPFLLSLGLHGFGVAEHRVPVIFTYGKEWSSGMRHPVNDAVDKATYIMPVELDRLQPTESLYRQLLVGRPEPLAPLPDRWPQILAALDGMTDNGLAGLLAGERLDGAITAWSSVGLLLPAMEGEQLWELNRRPV